MITDPSGLTTLRLEMGYRDVYCANYFDNAHGTTLLHGSSRRMSYHCVFQHLG